MSTIPCIAPATETPGPESNHTPRKRSLAAIHEPRERSQRPKDSNTPLGRRIHGSRYHFQVPYVGCSRCLDPDTRYGTPSNDYGTPFGCARCNNEIGVQSSVDPRLKARLLDLIPCAPLNSTMEKSQYTISHQPISQAYMSPTCTAPESQPQGGCCGKKKCHARRLRVLFPALLVILTLASLAIWLWCSDGMSDLADVGSTPEFDFKRRIILCQEQAVLDCYIRRTIRVSNPGHHALGMVLQEFVREPAVLPVLSMRVLWWPRMSGMY
ncbi:unnamed protein product [Rhizoctonia solani]|uniref:Uncharacterized protein n=1 Tax=Rhizoctonia solani TaxID=456999 RepID=A0A8H3GMY3_9AGAM|nr:unnamed protein product [Rhizoctonia solani]